jgi:hypothetical protein
MARKDFGDTVRLGTREVAGLKLAGERHTIVYTKSDAQIVHTFELWLYHLANPRMTPILIEERFEDANEVSERRLTNVATVELPSAVFAIPADFKVDAAVR